jgi:hypothetical protein
MRIYYSCTLLLVLAVACADNDVGMDAAIIGSPDAGERIDAGPPDGSGPAVDAEPDGGDTGLDSGTSGTTPIQGSVQARFVCADVCAAAGLACDLSFRHFLLGPGVGLAEYGDALGPARMYGCSERPDPTQRPFPQDPELALWRWTCHCR